MGKSRFTATRTQTFTWRGAIEIACVSGRDGLAARLRRQRYQLANGYREAARLDREPNSARIDRWENEGGALR